MLNLTIKLGKDVYIGDNIRIVVHNIDAVNKTVDLRFYAPKEIKILRGHLYHQKSSNSAQEGKLNLERQDEQ